MCQRYYGDLNSIMPISVVSLRHESAAARLLGLRVRFLREGMGVSLL